MASRLKVFLENIDSRVSSVVTSPAPAFFESLKRLVTTTKEQLLAGADSKSSATSEWAADDAVIERVLNMLRSSRTEAVGGSAGAAGKSSPAPSEVEQEEAESENEGSFNAEVVTEQEQEQQQEQEQEQQQEQAFDYSRLKEAPEPWPVSYLMQPPPKLSVNSPKRPDVFLMSARVLTLILLLLSCQQDAKLSEAKTDPVLYPLSRFEIAGRGPLSFPAYLLVSSNWYRPSWQSAPRRLKNVSVLMEWKPSSTTNTKLDAASEASGEQLSAMRDAFRLFDVDGDGKLGVAEVAALLRAMGSRSSQQQVASIVKQYDTDGSGTIEFNEFQRLYQSNVATEDMGRFFVSVSLAEAETLHCLAHCTLAPGAKGSAAPKAPSFALRSALDGALLSSSSSFVAGSDATAPSTSAGASNSAGGKAPPSSQYQRVKSVQVFRFVDSQMQYSEPDLTLVLRAVSAASMRERRDYFEKLLVHRRRDRLQWTDTPLAKLFAVKDEFQLLRDRARTARIVHAVRQKQCTLWDAFRCFDSDANGWLSRAEMKRGLAWLKVGFTASEEKGAFESADRNGDGRLNFEEFVAAFGAADAAADSKSRAPVSAASVTRLQPAPGDEDYLSEADKQQRIEEHKKTMALAASVHSAEHGLRLADAESNERKQQKLKEAEAAAAALSSAEKKAKAGKEITCSKCKKVNAISATKCVNCKAALSTSAAAAATASQKPAVVSAEAEAAKQAEADAAAKALAAARAALTPAAASAAAQAEADALALSAPFGADFPLQLPAGYSTDRSAALALEELSVATCKFIPVPANDDSWDRVDDLFRLAINGHIDDYNALRIKKGLRPITFRLRSADRIQNDVLQRRFERQLKRMQTEPMSNSQKRSKDDVKVRWSFHGTRPENIPKIARTGLLRVGHPYNPSKSTDPGWFGSPMYGVYVS